MRYLRFYTPMFQFSAFMGIFLGLYLIFMAGLMLFGGDISQITELKPETATPALVQKFKIIQFASAVCTFIVPAFLFNYLSDARPFQYAGFRKNTHPALLLFTVLILVASLPMVGLIGEWNSQFTWGMAQKEIEAIEERYNNSMAIILKMNGIGDLVVNLLLTAALPALAEEFFFRGTLQQCLFRWWKSPVGAVLGSSIFFALMHATFYKLIPILCMGIVLGTLFMVTRNIWCSILFHFLFNGMQIVVLYLAQHNKIKGFDPEKQEISFPVWAGITGLAAVVLLFAYLQKEKRRWIPASVFREQQTPAE
ncbi:CPBP family intramembrane glutamic endopeptidase [Parasegetibacter sp. NRK P23]|uniref:CPBP family intramembrane glutamic endopeptidase n=1 Tax=Parasegetibacter sp. NRK P23 TaxID=2942999 RepID=UPI0020432E39|nr:CPBP family intramembrane glutamic endopeptidase [Parasegetibacter sp. NRK P23]MCM5527961.1 CPBP family intramembrane metalloprotease [Parasegetibacter sp. NRK P23]